MCNVPGCPSQPDQSGDAVGGIRTHWHGGELFLLTKDNGVRLWRMKYRHAGKERLLSFVVYPEVPLAEQGGAR